MLAVFLYYCSMYALVDCNNFFASCERVFRPELQGKPIAVLSNNDGCVIARSNEVNSLNFYNETN
ncbi:protein ImpB [Flavobacteriaceae bacterium UJ101]|nr:protein ImpB [Flavobacteriaceae bacterium UJ101]